MNNNFDDFPADAIIAGGQWDTWDSWQYDISQEIKTCDYQESGEVYAKTGIPFLRSFELWIEAKLINAGFKKDDLYDLTWLHIAIQVADHSGLTYQNRKWDLNPPLGFPEGTYKISEDHHTMWINSDIQSALLTLKSIKEIKGLLVKNGVINKEAVKVYLCTLGLTITLLRSGKLPAIVATRLDSDQNSLATREIKKRLMRRAIKNIFISKPTTQKTLGDVWNKFDLVNKDRTFSAPKNEIYRLGPGVYKVKKGKDKKGNDAVIITKDDQYFSDYKKRSLQHFIDELK